MMGEAISSKLWYMWTDLVSKGNNSYDNLFLLWTTKNEVYSEKKEFAPMGANSFF